MRTRQVEYDEDDEDDRIVRDGGSLTSANDLMDHKLHNDLVRRNPPQRMTDALGRPAGQRPGYVFSTSIDDAAKTLLMRHGRSEGAFSRTLGATRRTLMSPRVIYRASEAIQI